MATNGSTSVAVTSYDTLKFVWTQVSQSIANNTTTISWSLQLVSGSAGKIVSSASKAWSVTVNGVTTSNTNSVAIENNATKTLASGQSTITHNADGAKVFSYSFSQAFGITFAGASVGTITGSGSGTLNTIPRATAPSLNVSSIDMGGTVTIYTPRASEAFTHDLSYSFAGGAFTTIQNNVGTYMYWMVPATLASSIPNATNGTITIQCVTKNGSTVIGTKTVLLTAKVPTSVVPTISSVAHAEANSAVIDAAIEAYVQGKSTVKVTVSAAGVSGSTIKSISSTVLGKTYAGASFTTDAIQQSGTVSIVTTATDSRGRTASKTTNISVLAYTPPKITGFSVARYNDAGEPDPNGTKVWAYRAYSASSLNGKNTVAGRMTYKRSDETAWTGLYNTTTLSADGTLKPTVVFSSDYQYDFKYTIADAFTTETPATYTTILPSGAVILDIRADGKGIAFFKTSTKDGVEIAGELPGSSKPLTTGANLNDLTKPGFYAIPSTTVSASILNKPYTDNATACIEVKRTGDGEVKQIIQKASKTDGAIYERDYDAGGWGAWNIVYSGAGKVLWTGSAQMIATDSLTFSEQLSQQQSGVVLVFSRYISDKAQDYSYSCHFVPKQLASLASTNGGQTVAGTMFLMTTSKFEVISAKYLRISNTGITGDAANNAAGTSNGVTYQNDQYALRYVIGV